MKKVARLLVPVIVATVLVSAAVAAPGRAGEPAWTRSIPGTEIGSPLVATLPDGSVVVATRWFRWVKTGPHEKTGDSGTVLARYSAAGDQLWLTRAPSKAAASTVFGLGVTTDGTIVTASGERYNGFYAKALAITRRDAAGRVIGRRMHGETSDATTFKGFTVAPDGSSFLLASVNTSKDPRFNRQTLVLRRYADDGASIWQRSIERDQNSADRPAAIATLPDGGVVIAREQYKQPGGGRAGDRFPAGSEIAITRFDGAGHEVWTRTPNPGGMAAVGGVVVNDDGVYIAGTTYQAIGGIAPTGDGDVFVAHYSTAGKLQRLAMFGGGDEDHANAVAATPEGFVVTGATDSPSLNGVTTYAADDAFAVTLRPDLETASTSVFGGPHVESGTSVAAGNGAIYMAMSDMGWYRDLYPEAQVSLVRVK